MADDHPGWRLQAVLTAAVLAISSSAVLVRGMDASPLAIAAWRTLGASVLLAPAWVPVVARVERRDRWGLLIGGACLAGHFAAWFASLQATTVLRSTLLVCTTPLWAGLLEVLLGGGWPRPRFVAGVVLAGAGVGVMTVADGAGADGAGPSWAGDGLAIAGAVLAAVYLRAGQSVRQQVGAGAAMGAMCAVAAALLGAVCVGVQVELVALPAQTWGLLVLAVLGPQLVGHQGFTWAVRWVPAATVALVTLLEPIGAALLAAVFLGEVPGPGVWLGGLLAVAGLAVAVGRRRGGLSRPGAVR